MGSLIALVGAGLVGIVVVGLWLLDVFDVLSTDRYARRMLMAVAGGLAVIALTSSGAFSDGVDRFVEWRTDREMERINDMLDEIAPTTEPAVTVVRERRDGLVIATCTAADTRGRPPIERHPEAARIAACVPRS